MIHTIKKAITIFSLVVFGSVVLYNCEPDADTLGEQLFLDDAAQGTETPFDIIAFNIKNNDSIRSDAAKLGLAVLGAFDEPQFGKQKASYFTQVRLSTYDPDFGTNADVDSVVLVIKPIYATDSVTTNTVDDNYTYTTAADGAVNAKKVVNTYPVLKFGKAKRTFTINVNEVNDFLKGASDSAKSNQTIAFDNTILGSKEFKGSVSSVAITKDDGGAALFTASAPGIRISLDKTFFKNKIIAKKGQPELADASNFIRYFKGLRVSVAEDDGYLFQFSPNDMELIMYYKYDKTDVTPATRPQATYSFALGSGNAHIGKYEYTRSTEFSNNVIGDMDAGDEKLFTQGMGGPSIGVKIPESTINELKELYNNKKAAIISAKIRIYTDEISWNNNYAKPDAFTLLKKYTGDAGKVRANFTDDVFNLVGSNNYSIIKAYDLDKNPAYYDFIVTKSVKDLVELQPANSSSTPAIHYFRIDMGAFLSKADNTGLAGYKSTSTPYNTSRAVLIGAKIGSTNPRKARLRVIYGTKK